MNEPELVEEIRVGLYVDDGGRVGRSADKESERSFQ